MSPSIFELCRRYDEAEKNFRTMHDRARDVPLYQRLCKVKEQLLAHVRESLGLVEQPRLKHLDEKDRLDVLAYFAAWHAARGGWKVATPD